jgi:CMP/dCMP kinase
MIIAIDGPSAAGKGTLARALAKHFGLHFLDTGALYRRVGFAVLHGHGDAVQVARNLNSIAYEEADLRDEKVAKAASKAASIPDVRQALLEFQRNFAQQTPGAVLDGRDIGTVICPHADYKFYITASVTARARRRFKELHATGISLAAVIADITSRDKRDAAQSLPAKDAVMIDTSDMTAEECLEKVIGFIEGS